MILSVLAQMLNCQTVSNFNRQGILLLAPQHLLDESAAGVKMEPLLHVLTAFNVRGTSLS